MAALLAERGEIGVSIRSFRRARVRREAKQARRATVLGRRSLLAASSALAATALMAGSAEAATLTVTNTADTGPGSLRAQLITANSDPGPDTITFAPSVTGTITAGSPLPITGNQGITIQGPGAGILAISGGDTNQVFAITSPESNTVHNEIDGLTITHGHTTDPGGAIGWKPTSTASTAQPLHLDNDVISSSFSSGSGGGVYSKGPVSLTGTTVTGNTATVRGGGLDLFEAGGTLTNSTVSGNTSTSGGGIDARKYTAYGSNSTNAPNGLTLVSSQVTGNHITTGSSSNYGGGIEDQFTALTLRNVTVSGNTAANSGTGNTTGAGVFLVPKYGATITNSTISGNTATVAGPAALSSGGGIMVGGILPFPLYLTVGRKYGPTVIQNSTISGNQATEGAGVEIGSLAVGSPATIDHSTISGNTGGANSFGGGIGVYGDIAAPFLLTDSTVSGNSAATGGAVAVGDPKHTQLFPTVPHGNGSVAFDNSTIAANTASTRAGGIYLGDYQVGGTGPKLSGTITIGSTIVAGNKVGATGQDLARAADSTAGGFTAPFSLVQTPGTTPVSGNQLITGVDPLLGPLQNNGGATTTMKPAGNSPVIDQGHVFKHLDTDQLGGPRTVLTGIPGPPGGDGTDIGAVELAAGGVIVPPPFTVNILSTLRPPGTALGTGTPLLIGAQTPIKCAVRTGTLASCAIVLRYRGRVVGQGNAGGGAAASSLTTTVDPTAAGLKALAGAPLGLDVQATAFGPASGAQVTGSVHFLGGPAITLPVSGRPTGVPNALKGQLGSVANILSGVRTVTCTAYTDKGPKRGAGDKALTLGQAKAACNTLKSKGLRATFLAVGAGHTHEVTSDRTAAGRRTNRRLVITFRF